MNIADAGAAIGMIAEYGECEKAIERITRTMRHFHDVNSGYPQGVKLAVFGRDFSFCPRRDKHLLDALILSLRQRMEEISSELSAIGVDTTPRAPAKESA